MSLVGKVMVFKGGSFSGHKRDFVAALATAQFGEDQAPGNDAAGSGASGRGQKQKATAEGVEEPAKKAVPRQPQQPSSKRQRVGLPPPPPRQTIDAGKLRLAARPSAWGVAKQRSAST